MANEKLRLEILHEATRLIHQRKESVYHKAKMRAARKICRGWVKPADLPSNQEIRLAVLRYSQLYESKPPAPDSVADTEAPFDQFQIFRALLMPLAHVLQNKISHPEGDALYHSLQVFELAREELPYDEEFLLAALLHDVGKGIDLYNHTETGLQALEGLMTARTFWLIQHHSQTRAILDGTIGVRAHKRLRESENYDELLLLGQCDRAGREPGVEVPDVDEALDYIRDLGTMYG